MNEVTEQQWRRILIRGTIVGFVGGFALVFGGCLLLGVSAAAAAGCAIVPAIQGSWFYGGTVYLLRADLEDERQRKNKRATATARAASVEPAGAAVAA